MKAKNLNSKINFNVSLNSDDLIVIVDAQIKYLINKGLKINNIKELEHIIENYGFNKLFRKYSIPFLKENDGVIKYQENISERAILDLYYFDYSFTNLLINYLGFLEGKLTGNIIHSLNLECQNVDAQLDYLWTKKQQPKLIKNIDRASNNGSDYLKPFIKDKIYPGWIILGELTLGEKISALTKIQNIEKILENFYLSNFNKKEFNSIFFDFIRPFRNVAAHFDRLLKFVVHLNEQQNLIFLKLMNKMITNKSYLQQVLNKNQNKINSYILILMITYLLGPTNATFFTKELNRFIKIFEIKEQQYFDIKEFLTAESIYNWPTDWKEILDHVLKNKQAQNKIINDEKIEEFLNLS